MTQPLAIAAPDVIRDRSHRRVELLSNAACLRERLSTACGLPSATAAGQIIALIIGSAETTMQHSAALRRRGLFVPGIRPPSVPQGQSLLRISLSYSHTQEMLDQLVESLVRISPRLQPR